MIKKNYFKTELEKFNYYRFYLIEFGMIFKISLNYKFNILSIWDILFLNWEIFKNLLNSFKKKNL